MGQRASRHEGGVKSVKTGLALTISGVREVNVLQYSHPVPLPIRSSVHENIIERARTPETPQHSNPQTLSNPSEDIYNAVEEVPVEIFLKVVEYLSPASVRSLSYTCRSLSRIFGASAAELMGERPGKPRLEPYWLFTDHWYRIAAEEAQKARPFIELNKWLELLIMLHRDNMWPGKAVCHACIGVHEESAFPESFPPSPPIRSRCLGTTGWVKICPHTQFDFWGLIKTCNSPEAYKRRLEEEHARIPGNFNEEDEDIVPRAWEARFDPEQMEEADAKTVKGKEARELARAYMAAEQERVWTTEIKTTCNQCAIPVTTTSWGKSRVCFPLAVISHWDPRSPSAKDLADHLKSLKAAVCPHIKINSSEVMKAYCHNRKRFRGRGCNCPACSVPYQECALCHARFWFVIGGFGNLKPVVQLIVERSFDPSVGVASSTWINQLIPQTASWCEHGSWWFDYVRFIDSRGNRLEEDSIKEGKNRWGTFYASRECSSKYRAWGDTGCSQCMIRR